MFRLFVFFVLSLLGVFSISCQAPPDPAGPMTLAATPTPTGPDSFLWTQATSSAAFGARGINTSVVYRNLMWVIAGIPFVNDVWSSSNGISWTQATSAAAFSRRCGHTSVVFNNLMWVIGGSSPKTGVFGFNYLNDAWCSSDGATWTQTTAATAFRGRQGHTSVVFNNKMWVIGGTYLDSGGNHYLNDIWYSSDGVTWIQATSAAAFSGRDAHTSVVYNNKMWVIGGYDGSYKSDVWYSSDGVSWIQATGATTFGSRGFHSSVVYDEKMWVMGGHDSGSYRNDVWYSSDGVTWTQALNFNLFNARDDQTSLVYNPSTGSGLDGALWVMGGNNGSSFLNDVWFALRQ